MGNLNFQTTASELKELFSAAGNVVDVHVPNDRETGQPRGFAFVEFSTDSEAAEAIQKFNGYELAGRQLRVNEAQDRARRGGGGGGPRPPRDNDGGGFDRSYGGDRRPPKNSKSRRGIRRRKRSL